MHINRIIMLGISLASSTALPVQGKQVVTHKRPPSYLPFLDLSSSVPPSGFFNNEQRYRNTLSPNITFDVADMGMTYRSPLCYNTTKLPLKLDCDPLVKQAWSAPTNFTLAPRLCATMTYQSCQIFMCNPSWARDFNFQTNWWAIDLSMMTGRCLQQEQQLGLMYENGTGLGSGGSMWLDGFRLVQTNSYIPSGVQGMNPLEDLDMMNAIGAMDLGGNLQHVNNLEMMEI